MGAHSILQKVILSFYPNIMLGNRTHKTVSRKQLMTWFSALTAGLIFSLCWYGLGHQADRDHRILCRDCRHGPCKGNPCTVTASREYPTFSSNEAQVDSQDLKNERIAKAKANGTLVRSRCTKWDDDLDGECGTVLLKDEDGYIQMCDCMNPRESNNPNLLNFRPSRRHLAGECTVGSSREYPTFSSNEAQVDSQDLKNERIAKAKANGTLVRSRCTKWDDDLDGECG